MKLASGFRIYDFPLHKKIEAAFDFGQIELKITLALGSMKSNSFRMLDVGGRFILYIDKLTIVDCVFNSLKLHKV